MIKKERVACLGPKGSYSHLAASILHADAELVLCPDFGEVVERLTDGTVEKAVLPVENSIQGCVLKCLDLLERYPVFADKEYVLKVDHRIAVRSGTEYEKIERIYSHEQALSQCAKYLRKRFPDATLIPTRSTVESLAKLDFHSAGIVGSHVQAEGIELSEENIADEKCNFTRFFRLVREGELPSRSRKMFFCAVCRHEPGMLGELLSVFATSKINLTKIESRPVADSFGEYRFFIEIEGDCADERIGRALELAQEKCRHFRLIGAY